MNFSELKDELAARGSDYLGGTRPDRFINLAYREIFNLQPWPFAISTATGDPDVGFVDIPDLRKILLVADASDGTNPGRRLGRTSYEELVGHDEANLDETGLSHEYYLDGQTTVRAFPVGGTIFVRYLKRVPAMSSPTDEPALDEEYHNLIVDRAMIEVYKDADEFDSAAAIQNDLNGRLVAMAEDYLNVSRDHTYIQVSPYDG